MGIYRHHPPALRPPKALYFALSFLSENGPQYSTGHKDYIFILVLLPTSNSAPLGTPGPCETRVGAISQHINKKKLPWQAKMAIFSPKAAVIQQQQMMSFAK